MLAPRVTVVVADSSVVINLIATGRLALLACLEGYRFVVPDEVVEELTWPAHRDAMVLALESGVLERVAVDALDASELLLALHDVISSGELSCLAVALLNGWSVACDEKRRFRRVALDRLGEDRLIGTVELYLAALRGGILSPREADDDRSALKGRGLRLPFQSFNDVDSHTP